MKAEVLAKYFLIASALLVLLTMYLSVYYAPLPRAGVRGVADDLPSLDGTQLTVAGFLADVRIREEGDVGTPAVVDLVLADFADYGRYRDAASDGSLEEGWWSVRPIDVRATLEDFSGSGLASGTNVSITGRVVAGSIGPNSALSGYFMEVTSSEDIEVGSSPGQFSVMSAPVAQKIFYFHMPSAWVSYLAFSLTLLFGAMYLRTKDSRYDRWAYCSAELGVLFATLAILTGPIWAKEEWGVYWRWEDTKLSTTFVLWLVYIGYLMLRASVQEPGTRARVSAVYGIVGFVAVPMSLLSSRIAPLVRSSHPQVIASSSGGLSPEAGLTIMVALMAFTCLFITMLIRRAGVAGSEEELEELKREVGGE